jgi:hypothetical protein
MKKLGIYGIVSGVLALLLAIGLSFYLYTMASTNLRKFGAETYLSELLLNATANLWLEFCVLFLFSLFSIICGIRLIRGSQTALKAWIAFYIILGLMSVFATVSVGRYCGIVELAFILSIILISFHILRKTKTSSAI